MKKLNLLLLVAFMVGSVGFFSSCTDELDANAPKPEVTVTSDMGTKTSFSPGETITFTMTVSTVAADGDIESVNVSPTVAGATGTTDPTTFAPDGMEGTFTYKYVCGDEGQVKITFEAAHSGGSTSEEVEFTVSKYNSEYADQILHNINAGTELYGSWDFVNNTGVSSTAAASSRDMVNTTPKTTPNLVSGIYSLSGTMFVKANSLDYANVTLSDAMAAYAGGTPESGSNDPASDFDIATGDVVVAKLRGGSDYVVVKIVDIYDADNNDGDKITFSYKKAPTGTAKGDNKVKLVYY